MDLVEFLQHHASSVEWGVRWLVKGGMDRDDATQLILIAADDLLRDVVIDLDGKHTHLRGGIQFYLAADPSSKALGAYIVRSAVRLATSRSKQDKFEDEISRTPFRDEPFLEEEPCIVVQDLIEKATEYAAAKGAAHSGVLRDILANEGLTEFSKVTLDAWLATGRVLDRIPRTFIYSIHGLSRTQGDSLVLEISRFLRKNNFNRRAA